MWALLLRANLQVREALKKRVFWAWGPFLETRTLSETAPRDPGGGLNDGLFSSRKEGRDARNDLPTSGATARGAARDGGQAARGELGPEGRERIASHAQRRLDGRAGAGNA